MTDKERLEEIKSRVWKDKGTYAMGDYSQREGYIYTLSDYDYEWLIEQAELVGYFARKNGELNEFLNKYIEPKHLGKNVIDVAMDIIVKQAERVQELEKQNKRYKQALEFYADEEHYKEKLISEAQYDADGICISNDEYAPPIIYFDSGVKARQALEG